MSKSVFERLRKSGLGGVTRKLAPVREITRRALAIFKERNQRPIKIGEDRRKRHQKKTRRFCHA